MAQKTLSPKDIDECKAACVHRNCRAVNLYQLGEFQFKCEILGTWKCFEAKYIVIYLFSVCPWILPGAGCRVLYIVLLIRERGEGGERNMDGITKDNKVLLLINYYTICCTISPVPYNFTVSLLPYSTNFALSLILLFEFPFYRFFRSLSLKELTATNLELVFPSLPIITPPPSLSLDLDEKPSLRGIISQPKSAGWERKWSFGHSLSFNFFHPYPNFCLFSVSSKASLHPKFSLKWSLLPPCSSTSPFCLSSSNLCP